MVSEFLKNKAAERASASVGPQASPASPGPSGVSSFLREKAGPTWAPSFVAYDLPELSAVAPEQGRVYSASELTSGYNASYQGYNSYNTALESTLTNLGATPENVWDVLAQKHGAVKDRTGKWVFQSQVQLDAYSADATRLNNLITNTNSAATTTQGWSDAWYAYRAEEDARNAELDAAAEARLAEITQERDALRPTANQSTISTQYNARRTVLHRSAGLRSYADNAELASLERAAKQETRDREREKARAQTRIDALDIEENQIIDARDFRMYASAPYQEDFADYVAAGKTAWAQDEEIEARISEDVGLAMDVAAVLDTGTEAERDMLYYIYAKYGADRAENYLYHWRRAKNQESGLAAADWLDSINIPVVREVMTYGYQAGAGLDSFMNGVSGWLADERVPESASAFASAELIARADEKGWGWFKPDKWLQQASNTVGNMAPAIAAAAVATYVAGPAGAGLSASAASSIGAATSAAAIGVSSGGNSYQQALREGYSVGQARTYGIMTGASEAALSYLIGGAGTSVGLGEAKLLAKASALDSAFARVLTTGAVKVGSEILEEELQLFIEPAIRSLVFDENYEAPGWKEMAETAIVTAIATGLLEGKAITSARFEPFVQALTEDVAENPAILNGLLVNAELLDSSTKTAKLAASIEKKLAKGEKVPAGTVRSFIRAYYQDYQANRATQQAIDEAQTTPYNKEVVTETATVLNRGESAYTTAGLPAAEAKTAAGIVQDLIDGKPVSDNKLKQLRLDNPKFREVFTELTGVEFPEVVSKVQMRALARSAKNAVQETPAVENEVQNAETETPSLQNEVQSPTAPISSEATTGYGAVTQEQALALAQSQGFGSVEAMVDEVRARYGDTLAEGTTDAEIVQRMWAAYRQKVAQARVADINRESPNPAAQAEAQTDVQENVDEAAQNDVVYEALSPELREKVQEQAVVILTEWDEIPRRQRNARNQNLPRGIRTLLDQGYRLREVVDTLETIAHDEVEQDNRYVFDDELLQAATKMLLQESAVRETQEAQGATASQESETPAAVSAEETAPAAEPRATAGVSESPVVVPQKTRDLAHKYGVELQADGKGKTRSGKRSPQAQNVVDRAAKGESFSLEELNAIPEVAMAREEVEGETETINRPNRGGVVARAIETAMQRGSYSGKDADGRDTFNGEVRRERRVDIVIGLPGSGKSSVYSNPISQERGSRIIDTDDYRELIPEYNGRNAALVHEEASAVKKEILSRATDAGENILLSIVGSEPLKLAQQIVSLRDMGYAVHLHLNHLPNAKAMGRVIARYVNENGELGRLVTPKAVLGMADGPMQAYLAVTGQGGMYNADTGSEQSAGRPDTGNLREGRGGRDGVVDGACSEAQAALASWDAYSNDVELGQPAQLLADISRQEVTPSNRDSDTVESRRGPVTRAQFREAMRRQPQFAEATDAELDAIFDDYRRDAEADDDIRFSVEGLETMLNMPWKEQYANRDSLPENSAMYTRETPDAVRAVGLRDLALTMTTKHAKAATSGVITEDAHAHHVTDEVVERLPELMENPVMILDSNTVPGDIMVVLDALDTQGNPVVATVHPNGHAWVGGEKGRANFITSVYGRDNLAVRPGADSKNNLLYLLSRPDKRGVLYWNRALTEELFQKANLRVPNFLQSLPSDTVLKKRARYNPNYIVERGVFDVSEEENNAQDNRATHRGSSQRPGRNSADGGRAGRNPDHSAPGRDGGVRGQQTAEGVQGQDPGRTAPSVPGTVRGPAQETGEGPVGRGTVGEHRDGGVHRGELGEARAQDETRGQVNKEDVNAAPRFNNWDEAFIRLNDGVEGVFGPDPIERAMLPTFDLSYKNEKGKWVTLASYPKTAEGLARLNEDLPGFVADRKVSAAKQTTSNKTDDALVEKCTADLFFTKDGYEYTDEQLVHPHNGKKFTVHALNLDKHASAKVRKRARFYEKLGFRTLLVPKGEILFNLNQMAGGVTVRNTRGQAFILVQDSDAQRCVTMEHEGLHARLFVDHGLFFDIRRALIDAGYEKAIDRLRKNAETAWAGVYKPGKMGKKSAEYKYSYEQEVYAEAMAGNPGKLGNDILAIQPIVQAVVEQWDAQFMEMRKQKPRGWTPEHSRPNVFELEWGYNDDWTPGIDDDSTQIYGDEMFELDPKQQAWAEKFNAMHGEGTAEAVAAAVTDAFFHAQEEAKTEPVTASSVGSNAQLDEELLGWVIYKAKPSVGAADYNFDPYSRMQFEYGTIDPTGKNNHRVMDPPRSTNGVDRVSHTTSTVMNAKATPESRLGTIAGAVVDGKLSHNIKTDARATNRARYTVRKNGFDKALAEWRSDVDEGHASKDLVAMGAVLLNNAGNSDMSGEAYVDLLVDYTDLLTRAGQSLQAAKLFKNLTPESRLYALQRTLNRMNRNVRPTDNVPVDMWMKKVGDELARRVVKKAKGGPKTAEAKTVCQTILSDLARYANEHLAKEETPGLERTEMDRILDLFHNYEHYTKALEEAKQAVLEKYGHRQEIVDFLNEWGESELDYARMLTNQLLGTKEVTMPRELAAEYLNAETDEAREEVMDKILDSVAAQIPATFMDKFTTLRYTSMLGNLKTVLRNTSGNVVMRGAVLTKTTFAGLAEALLERYGANIERTTSVHRDQETLNAAEAEFKKVKDIIARGGRYGDESSNLPAEIRDRQRIFKTEAFEKARKGVKWLMDNQYFGDYAFSYVTFRDALARYIAANHTTWSQASEELKGKALEKAVTEAAEATFRDQNAVSDAIVQLRFRNPDTWVKKGLNVVGEGVLPFRRTPANIGVRMWEYSPLGFATTAVEAVRAKKGLNSMTGADIVNELAKNATGTALMLIGLGLASAGVLKAGAPDDEKEKELWEMQGHQEYALEIGGVSYTIDWAAPAATAMFLGAALYEAFSEDGVSVRDMTGLVGRVFDPMLEMSMLQGVDDALSNAQTYGDDSAVVRFIGNALWSYVSQPVPTLLGQLERSLSNKRMTTYADKNVDTPDGVQRALGKLSSKIPGWDYAQVEYVDAWGRTQKNASNGFLNVIEQFISPGYANTITESDMEKELLRLYGATGESSVLISNAPKYFTVDNQRVDLTAAEYLTYATTRGQTAYQLMTDLTSSAAYQALSDEEKALAVQDVYDLANQVAKDTVTAGETGLDGWVKEARACASQYGVQPQVYIAAKAAVGSAEGVTDTRTGKTVSGSKSMAMMLALYEVPGLTDAQRKDLAEDLGIGKEARGLSKGILERRLNRLRTQNP